MHKTLTAIEEGRGKEEDLKILEFHTKYLGPGNTFCAFAPGAMEPLQSALKYFRSDFEKHIHDHSCPYEERSSGHSVKLGDSVHGKVIDHNSVHSSALKHINP